MSNRNPHNPNWKKEQRALTVRAGLGRAYPKKIVGDIHVISGTPYKIQPDGSYRRANNFEVKEWVKNRQKALQGEAVLKSKTSNTSEVTVNDQTSPNSAP